MERKPLGTGVTHSQKLTLSDGTRTLHAAFKTINERIPTARMDLGGVEIDGRDGSLQLWVEAAQTADALNKKKAPEPAKLVRYN